MEGIACEPKRPADDPSPEPGAKRSCSEHGCPKVLSERQRVYNRLATAKVVEVDNIAIPIQVLVRGTASFPSREHSYEAIIFVDEKQAQHVETDDFAYPDSIFVMDVDSGGEASYIRGIFPNSDSGLKLKGSTLLHLADKLNSWIGVSECALSDQSTRVFCNDSRHGVPMDMLYMLAYGKSWYMGHGYDYENRRLLQDGLQRLACLREQRAADTFLAGGELEDLAAMGETVGDAFRVLTDDLYSDKASHCALLKALADNLSELGDWLGIMEKTLVKNYRPDASPVAAITCLTPSKSVGGQPAIDLHATAVLNGQDGNRLLAYEHFIREGKVRIDASGWMAVRVVLRTSPEFPEALRRDFEALIECAEVASPSGPEWRALVQLGIEPGGGKSRIQTINLGSGDPRDGDSRLVRFVDAVNEHLSVPLCTVDDGSLLRACGGFRLPNPVPMHMVHLLADGKSWLMQHGFHFHASSVVSGLESLGCLRAQLARKVFLSGRGLDVLGIMGDTVAAAFRALRADLYSGQPQYCSLWKLLASRLYELAEELGLSAPRMLKQYYIDAIGCNGVEAHVIDKTLVDILNPLSK